MTAGFERSLILLLVCSLLLSACANLPTIQIFPSSPSTQLPSPSATSPQPGSTVTQSLLNHPTPTAVQPTLASSIGVQPSRLQGQTVRFWYLLPESARLAKGADLIQAAAANFQANNPWGIRVEGEAFSNPEDLYQKLQSPASTGAPDLLMLYPYQANRIESSGPGLVDLAPYLNDPQWGLPPEQAGAFYPVIWQQDLLGGKRIGLPFTLVPQVLLYNQTWAAELGFATAPDTPEEFRTQACEAAGGAQPASAGLTNRPGGWAIDASAPVMLSWLDAFGAGIVSSNRQGYTFNTSQVTETFTFLRKLYDDGCAWKPGTLPPAQEFAARKALFISISLSGLPAVESALTQAKNQDHWTILPYPSPQGKPALTASSPSWSITRSQPEHQLAAWLLLRELVAPGLQAAWASAYSSWPVSASSEPELADEHASHPAWSGSFNLLPLARPEPSLASWGEIRWVLSDASERLFSVTFYAEQIPLLVKMLDDTAKEIGGMDK